MKFVKSVIAFLIAWGAANPVLAADGCPPIEGTYENQGEPASTNHAAGGIRLLSDILRQDFATPPDLVDLRIKNRKILIATYHWTDFPGASHDSRIRGIGVDCIDAAIELESTQGTFGVFPPQARVNHYPKARLSILANGNLLLRYTTREADGLERVYWYRFKKLQKVVTAAR